MCISMYTHIHTYEHGKKHRCIHIVINSDYLMVHGCHEDARTKQIRNKKITPQNSNRKKKK